MASTLTTTANTTTPDGLAQISARNPCQVRGARGTTNQNTAKTTNSRTMTGDEIPINPYLLSLPAVVSFSGGRTSGYLLRKILDANGQPDDLKIIFNNTGLEAEETLVFVKACGERWECDITWLEYCVTDDGEHDFKIVDFDSASRNGEPFTALIRKRGSEGGAPLPSPVARFCSVQLKMRTGARWLKTIPAFEEGYTNAVGLRADEMRRVTRLKPDNAREEMLCPMARAEDTIQDVLEFWSQQPFDLGLPVNKKGESISGNCNLCHLKSRPKLDILLYHHPEWATWWIEAEKLAATYAKTPAGAVFRQDRPSYALMLEQVQRQGQLPFGGVVPDKDHDTIPCMCHD